jgi:hypothetical protein
MGFSQSHQCSVSQIDCKHPLLSGHGPPRSAANGSYRLLPTALGGLSSHQSGAQDRAEALQLLPSAKSLTKRTVGVVDFAQ